MDGKCACGCGGTPPIASKNRRGYRTGDRMRFVHGHNRRVVVPAGTAYCPRCKAVRALAEFSPAPQNKSGRRSYCKLCNTATVNEYREANREVVAQKAAVYNRNQRRRERQRELVRAWASRTDRGRLLRMRRDNEQNRRARLRAAFVEDVDSWVMYRRDNGLCGICGEQVDVNTFHIDHIIPLAIGGAHSYKNVQLAHPRCNLSKGARMV